MSSWTDLPPELLQLITEKQTNYVDYISSRAVCKSWRAALPKNLHRHSLLRQLPWLLLPYNKNIPKKRGFYNLSNDTTYSLELPEAFEKRCCGSSHGWLIMVEDSPEIFLLNPLTKGTILLPPLSTLPDFPTEVVGFQNSVRDTLIRKAIISEDPSAAAKTNFTVMAIYMTVNDGENLAFCRSGDSVWSTIPETFPAPHYRDIIFSSGKFFVVDEIGKVSICNTEENPVSITHFANPPLSTPPNLEYKQWYLGFLNGDLLLIRRFRNYGMNVPSYDYQTCKFTVYSFDSRKWDWLELGNLGDRIFFLGWNCFHSISALDYENCRGKGNCIYFTDDNFMVCSDFPWEGHDFGIFRCDDGSMKRLELASYPIKLPSSPNIYYYENSLYRDQSLFILPPPLWVTINP